MVKVKRTLDLKISVWFRPEDNRIHLKIDGQQKPRFSTISYLSEHKRGHRHLFNHLKEELVAAGKWDRND